MAPNTKAGYVVPLLFLVIILGGLEEARATTKRKETHISFYMHDTVAGKQKTGLTVAGSNGSSSSVLSFGAITVLDHALTEGLDRRSKQVGRAQGMYVGSALDGLSFHFLFSIVFTNGKYNGSTLEIQGPDRLVLKQREVSVVSGTGVFRFCRGYALFERAFFDPVSLNAVLKFNVTVRYY